MSHKRTHFLLLLTVICWGFNATILKTLITTLDIKVVLILRVLLATVFLIFIRIFVLKKTRFNLSPYVMFYSILGGFLYLYVQLEFHLHGLLRTTATNAVLITAFVPSMSILFEAVFFKKRFSAVNLMGTLFAVIGVAFVMLNKEQFNNSNWIGNLLIVLSVITACLGGVMIQKLSKTNDHLTTSTLIHLVGSIIFLGDLLFSSLDPSRILQSISVIQWLFILFFSIVNGAVATVLWTRGISEIGLAKTSAYLPLVPFVGIISNSLLLGEQLTIYHGIGLACVAIGTFFATREEGFTFAKAPSVLR